MRVQKMAHEKVVDLQRITNDKTRMTTYKKRRACLYKKAGEFSTLCGVQTCIIVYGPTKATDELISKPEIWPEDETKARDIIRRYRDTVSNSCRKEAHVETFVNDKGKAKETENTNNNNKRGMNNKNKYCCWEERLEKCSQEQLRGIFDDVGNKLHEAIMRQNRNAITAQHQVMEPQTPQNLMDPYYVSQYFAGHQQQQCLMFPYNNMSFPLFSPHDDQIPMEPILVENFADSGVNQGFMMSKGNESTQFMQRQAPYYIEPVVQRPASFNVNPFTGYQVPYNIPRLPGNQAEVWDFMAKKPI